MGPKDEWEAFNKAVDEGRMIDQCIWCDHDIYDGAPESGGKSPDWCFNGDYGCNEHPISNEEGVGPHETSIEVQEIVRQWHHLQMYVSALPTDEEIETAVERTKRTYVLLTKTARRR